MGRWTTPDPLQEDEYWGEFDKLYAEELNNEGFSSDSEDLIEGRRNAGILNLLGPVNRITARNSAVHYNSSPYSYVLNNPIGYVDLNGLDSTKTVNLNTVTVTAKKSSGVPHWLGPGMIFLGQPINALKPVGALGSQPGSSIASYTLAKVFPQTVPALKKAERKAVGLVSKKLAKKAGTAVVGRFIGRLVPGVGWVITSYDIYDNRAAIGEGLSTFGSGAGDYNKLQQSTGILR